MSQQCKDCRALIPTVMKMIKQYTSFGTIVERAVGILIICEHPNRKEILRSAIMQFPESDFFKKYIDVLEIPGLSKP